MSEFATNNGGSISVGVDPGHAGTEETEQVGMADGVLFNPGRRISFVRVFADDDGVYEKPGDYQSTLSCEYVKRVNDQCKADGQKPLFRKIEDVDLSGLGLPTASLTRQLGSKLMGLFA